ncbi:MAG: tetratricopeptide repeat protein [bacterium]
MFKLKFNLKNFFKGKIKKSEKDIYQLIIQTSINLTVLLVPFFSLPLAYDPWELPKALLFYILILIGLIAWLIRIFVQKKVDFVKTPFNPLILFFGLAYLLAAIFSANRFQSFWGGGNQFGYSWLTNLFFIGWFFLLVNNLKSLKEVVRILMFFVLALALVVIFSFCQIFGWDILFWLDWPGLPFFALTGGAPESLVIFLAASSPLLMILLMLAQKGLDRVLLAVLLALDLILIFILSQRPGLMALMFGFFALLFFLVWQPGLANGKTSRLSSALGRFSNVWLIWLSVLIVLTIVALFLPLADWWNLNLPDNLRLPGQTSWQIAVQTIKNHWLLGVGPQNFSYAFAQYRPIEFNQSVWWNMDFTSSGFQWLDILVGFGLAGVLAWLALGLKYFRHGFLILLRWRGWETAQFLAIGIFVGLLTIAVAGFLAVFNFTLVFLAWFFLALGVLVVFREKNIARSFSFNESSLSAFFSSLVLIVLLVLSIGVLYFGSRVMAGEIYFTKAVRWQMADSQKVDQMKNNLAQAKNYLEKAIKANPGQARYHLILAQNLNQTISLSANQAEAGNLALAGLNEVERGLDYNRGFISYYRAAGEILENLRPIIPQANEVLIGALRQALELSPNNPVFHLNLGRAYLFGQSVLTQLATAGKEIDQQFAQQAGQYFQLAGGEFEKAVALKSQWAPAHYQLALFLEQQGRVAEAITEMDLAWQLSPDQAQVAYQLGRLYKNQNRPDDAIKLLEKSIQLSPNLLNAHLELIDIYESGSDKQKAIEAVRQALAVFPDHEELKAKLTALGKKK